MRDALHDIAEFHRHFQIDYDGGPRLLPTDLARFRIAFKLEEVKEMAEALGLKVTYTVERGDRPAIHELPARKARFLDAQVDLAYVLLGTTHLSGMAEVFPPAWRLVHNANMKKVRASPENMGPRGDASFDVIKPPGWQAPDLSHLVLGVSS